ncbi:MULTISPECIES: sodium/sugar symporter [unclassified Pedobacter]|uniref:sodium/sugar symporter n=1 Tax=unclassified Pedobacter TaxID=2628915 RepID=UPI00141F8E2B|nr:MULTISPECIES: sodium/sugar symporter [unclassified Pedobacter]NII82363.1 SSS family solute:Na+ symporter [Pedobacter sp. SG908]NMN36389.1 SSS family solute:Na+ symporter [Pedobacter sp. SG918]
MNHLSAFDYAVFLMYFIIVSAYGYWVYRSKKKKRTDTKDYFLAEGSLTWWAIGASIIASNISAEHFIGMSGSGFAMGLAIASYEWMAAATLIIVAIFFLPIYIKNKIYTMPQFLSNRYNNTVSTLMAVFWLLVYVFVNLTSIFFLGAIAIETITGIPFNICIIFLAIFSAIITLGGMKVIGYTDVIQVFVLVTGGLITCYMALKLVSEKLDAPSVLASLPLLRSEASDHFHMIFSKGDKFYSELPGIAVLLGGLWINNLNYWGCNQYIVQRALGADLKTGRNGLIFAAFLKLLIPVIVVIPGIAAYVLYQRGYFQSEMLDAAGTVKPDHAYPVLMNLLPAGIKGLAFAALTAAIVASLAGKCNSIATIFTLDIYKKFIKPEASETRLVSVGRWSVVIASLIAIVIAPALRSFDQVYQFIQEYVGFISPGVFAIFLLGFFWKKTTSRAALIASLLTIPLSTFFKFLPTIASGAIAPIPFLNRMSWVFVIILGLMVLVTLTDPKSKDNPQGLEIDSSMFKVTPAFTIASVIICGILAALYTVFW